VLFSADDDDPMEMLALTSRLRRAVDQQHWVLHYQPVIDLSTGNIMGVEGLLRWQDPRGGLIAPGEFIPLAEEMGLIEAIGDWVVAEVARQESIWESQGIHLETGFNLSPRQLWQPDLVFRVLSHLERAGADPARIVVEITETAAMTDPDRTQRVLWELHGRGVRLAIDDFGTGYSSLTHLRRFPVEALKVDKSFVAGLGQDPENDAIVAMILGLAKTLGLRSVAEGVEDERRFELLRQLGCTEVQGFLFGKPLPPSHALRAAGTLALSGGV